MKLGLMTQNAKFELQKRSPELLLIAGVAGVITGTVLACRATLKAKDILKEKEEQMEFVRKAQKDIPEKYSKEDVKKDTFIVYSQAALKLGRIYAPAIIISAASLVCIFSSHNILKQRNIALAAAYAAVDRGFKEYRSRVADRFGKEVDHQLRYNIKAEEIEETVTDEKGKEKKVKKKINVANPNAESVYEKYYTKTNPNWSNDPFYNENFFKIMQSQANDMLKAYGHLTLNQVYNLLGFKDTKAGMVVGWIYDPKNPTGDNFVELDYKEVCIPNEVGEYEWGYAIDFNVDGNIYNLMS